jgi:hypothetical protein
MLVWVCLLSSGCSSGVSSSPVPECQQYEATLSSCFHRPPSGLASQPSLIPKTKADLERIRATCATNLERLQRSCH